MKTKIEVTQADIDGGHGWPRSKSCPVFLAMKRAGVRVMSVRVGRVAVKTCERHDCHEYKLPLEVTRWILNFDSGSEECKPLVFELDTSRKIY